MPRSSRPERLSRGHSRLSFQLRLRGCPGRRRRANRGPRGRGARRESPHVSRDPERTISGGPLPADPTSIVVNVWESDSLCGLPNGEGCTPFENAGTGFTQVASTIVPTGLPAVYSVTVPAPPTLGSGAYVVTRFFAIEYIAVGPQGNVIAEVGGGTSSTPCASTLGSTAQAFVCNGSFARGK
jgi:hypothetical protein